MKIDLSLRDVEKGLEENLVNLWLTPINNPITFSKYLALSYFDSRFIQRDFLEMRDFTWGLNHFNRLLKSYYVRDKAIAPVLKFEQTVVNGIESAVKSAYHWQENDPKGLSRILYETSKKAQNSRNKLIKKTLSYFKKRIDSKISTDIKNILAFRSYIDAQTVAQHTEEFSHVFDIISSAEIDEVVNNKWLVGGYHARGIVEYNLIRKIMYFCDIHPKFRELSLVVSH